MVVIENEDGRMRITLAVKGKTTKIIVDWERRGRQLK